MIPPLIVKIFGRDGLSPKLAGIQKKLNSFSTSMNKVGRTMSVGLSVPMGLFGKSTLSTAGDFEYGMNRVTAITGATGKSFEKLRNQAKHLGETTTFTAGEVTEGMQMLAQAGLPVEDIYNSIGVVLKGAQANMVDMSEAANIGSGLMRTFGYTSKEMITVMDMLTKTSMSSMTNFTELAEAFLYAGPSAGAMGKTLKETSAVLGSLANGMMKGSMAGTALRGMMAKLSAPTTQAVKIMQSLGISYDDILDKKGNVKSFVDVVKAFEKTNVTAGQVLEIFGLRAGPGFQILLNQGSKALEDMMNTVGEFGGTTEKISKVQMQGFKGQLKALTSAFEGFQIAIADSGILVFATKFAKKVTEIFQTFAKANPRLLKFGFIIGLIVAAIGPMLVMIAAITSAFAAISPVVLIVAGAIAGLIATFSALYIWFDPIIDFTSRWGWILGLLTGPIGWLIWGVSLLVKHWDELIDTWKLAFEWLEKLLNKFSESKIGNWMLETFGGMGTEQAGGMGTRTPIQPFYSAIPGVNTPKANINVNIANAPKGTTADVTSENLNTRVEQGLAFSEM